MKAFLALSCLVLVASVNGANIPRTREGKTLGILQSAGNGALGIASTALGTAGTVARVAGVLIGAKTLAIGLGGKYALYKYLKNKSANNGLHIGGSAGFGLGGAGSHPVISNAADNFSFDNAAVYTPSASTYTSNAAVYPPAATTYDTVVINEPVYAETPVFTNVAAFDNTPVFTNDFAAFDNAQAFANVNNGQIVAAGPFVTEPQFVPQQVSQFVPQQVSQVSFDNVDEYGAPQAPLTRRLS